MTIRSLREIVPPWNVAGRGGAKESLEVSAGAGARCSVSPVDSAPELFSEGAGSSGSGPRGEVTEQPYTAISASGESQGRECTRVRAGDGVRLKVEIGSVRVCPMRCLFRSVVVPSSFDPTDAYAYFAVYADQFASGHRNPRGAKRDVAANGRSSL